MDEYIRIQSIAKQTIEQIKTILRPGMQLKEIREMCEKTMLALGADSFWYYDIGALCFCGDETTISVSGTRYKTANKEIQTNDSITIDLSPQYKNIWGDYARTIIIEEGIVVEKVENIQNIEWRNGLEMEELLHQEMKKFVTIDTTFEELYFYINTFIIEHGYINLDFAGNLGHSIVTKKEDRIYIEKGNTTKLSEVAMFTFEPHISVKDSKYGYKQEDIYYFEKNILKKL